MIAAAYTWATTVTCSDGEDHKVLYTKLTEADRELCVFGYTGVANIATLLAGEDRCVHSYEYMPMDMPMFRDYINKRCWQVYLAYSAHRDARTLEAWCSDEYVAQHLHLTVKQLERCKMKLRRAGLLSKAYTKFKPEYGRKVYHVRVYGHVFMDTVYLPDEIFLSVTAMPSTSEQYSRQCEKNRTIAEKKRAEKIQCKQVHVIYAVTGVGGVGLQRGTKCTGIHAAYGRNIKNVDGTNKNLRGVKHVLENKNGLAVRYTYNDFTCTEDVHNVQVNGVDVRNTTLRGVESQNAERDQNFCEMQEKFCENFEKFRYVASDAEYEIIDNFSYNSCDFRPSTKDQALTPRMRNNPSFSITYTELNKGKGNCVTVSSPPTEENAGPLRRPAVVCSGNSSGFCNFEEGLSGTGKNFVPGFWNFLVSKKIVPALPAPEFFGVVKQSSGTYIDLEISEDQAIPVILQAWRNFRKKQTGEENFEYTNKISKAVRNQALDFVDAYRKIPLADQIPVETWFAFRQTQWDYRRSNRGKKMPFGYATSVEFFSKSQNRKWCVEAMGVESRGSTKFLVSEDVANLFSTYEKMKTDVLSKFDMSSDYSEIRALCKRYFPKWRISVKQALSGQTMLASQEGVSCIREIE